MTEDATASASAPPAAQIDVTLPTVSYFWTRLFSWIFSVAIVAIWTFAIYKGATNVWPYCAALSLIVAIYVAGARATDIVQIVQSSGIIRAAQATAGAVTAAANAAGALVGAVRPGAGGPPPPQDDERG